MKIKTLFLSSLLFTFPAFTLAEETAAPTLPTEASKPVPSLLETQNKDTVLSEKVQKAINENKLLKGQAVSAASVRGNITLQGSVESKQQEQAAINTAKEVPGVLGVTSQLTVKAVKQ